MWPANPSSIEWIAADWGTSRIRVWAMTAGRVAGERSADAGMGRLEPGKFESCFINAAEGWLAPDTPILAVVCGMAGAREGWCDAGYRPVPARIAGEARAVKAPTADGRLDVRILSGLSQEDPAGVMRGEETQIAGLLREEPDYAGLVVLPGTHTKWVKVQDASVQAFSTYMTGELFQLLGTHSILRHSLDASDAWDWAQFDDALGEALANPGGITQRLFGLRARSLLKGLSPAGVRARISAELIGLEIASGRKEAEGQPVTLIGADHVNSLYRHALARAGIEANVRSGEAMVLAGLIAAREWLRDA
jgi:2-dehydro-3-deoxygalactonokinase